MTFVKLISRDGWLFPVNEKGETDWVCPKCGHQHTSCCGNSHFPCKEGPNYGGKCECRYLDDMMPSFDLCNPATLEDRDRVKKLEKTLNRLVHWLDWFLHQECGNQAHTIYDILDAAPPEYLGLENNE